MVKRVLVKWSIFLFFHHWNTLFYSVETFKNLFETIETVFFHCENTVDTPCFHRWNPVDARFFTSWKHHCNTQMLVICLTGNKRCFIWLWRVLFCPTTEKLPEVNRRLSYCHWKKWRHTLLPSPMTYMVWAGRPIREEVHYVCIS